MKRNMDLIRQIAFFVEQLDEPIFSGAITIPGFSRKEVSVHCAWMVEKGLLWDTDEAEALGEPCPDFVVARLTWEGCDFIDAARNQTVWNRVTSAIKDKATSLAFDSLMNLLKAGGQQLADKALELAQ